MFILKIPSTIPAYCSFRYFVALSVELAVNGFLNSILTLHLTVNSKFGLQRLNYLRKT